MLSEHLKRTVRISKPTAPITPKRKGTHWIVYIFLSIVLIIILGLLLITYDFSIHQPEFAQQEEDTRDVIVESIITNTTQDIDINNKENIINNKDINNNEDDVSSLTSSAWPLVTTNGPNCEGIFGNSYQNEIMSCSTELSQFKCKQNPFSQQIYCHATNFIINPEMINIANGGEEIMAVKGRKEDDEFPKYESNPNTGDTAFNVDCEPNGDIPKENGISYYFHKIVMFLRNIGVGDPNSKYHEKYLSNYNDLCKNINDNDDNVKIFLITMRYEYANMYHQATDWYNFFQLIHSMGIDKEYEIIFLDGHAKSQIDQAWNYGINGKYNFIKQLNDGKPICLKNAYFVSAGYVGGISLKTVFKGCKQESKYVQQFGTWFLNGFDIKQITERKDNKISITLTCRHDYIAHPRNLRGKATRKFASDENVEQKIKDAIKDINDIEFNIRRVAWSDYSFKEQLQIAASTDIFIGAHGAGLTHVLFLPPKSGLIEIAPMGFDGEPHFEAFSKWCGHKYTRIRGGAEFRVDPDTKQFSRAIVSHVQFITSNIY